MTTNDNTNPGPVQTRTPVAVLGLGLMGRALAAALLGAGHPTTVWNRSPGKADALAAQGAVRARTAADAVRSAPVVIVCVSTYDVVHQVLDPLAADVDGRTLLNLTSGTPEEARRAASWAAAHGADYLDGAIMGVPQMIGLPGTLLLHGGPRKTFDAQEPLLRVLGGANTYLGDDPGLPLLYDMALLTLLYATGQGLTHAQAMVGTAGVSATEFQPHAASVFHTVLAGLFDAESARVVDEADYATEVSNISTNQLAVGHIIRTSRELGLPTDWLAPVQAGLDRAVREGHAADNPARLIEYVRPDSP
ncbi:NAD(P)-dependent oxidoreductase [Streptomyces uncialis]|uniref:NAD(P)-dependent oxidoreductase n=1 Tax=Streptomyces uncialis TaxID=1048205 RepID=UPI00386E4B87|nr:NAD(P)-binding domain-containing protein [Streptomyces uncialis]